MIIENSGKRLWHWTGVVAASSMVLAACGEKTRVNNRSHMSQLDSGEQRSADAEKSGSVEALFLSKDGQFTSLDGVSASLVCAGMEDVKIDADFKFTNAGGEDCGVRLDGFTHIDGEAYVLDSQFVNLTSGDGATFKSGSGSSLFGKIEKQLSAFEDMTNKAVFVISEDSFEILNLASNLKTYATGCKIEQEVDDNGTKIYGLSSGEHSLMVYATTMSSSDVEAVFANNVDVLDLQRGIVKNEIPWDLIETSHQYNNQTNYVSGFMLQHEGRVFYGYAKARSRDGAKKLADEFLSKTFLRSL